MSESTTVLVETETVGATVIVTGATVIGTVPIGPQGPPGVIDADDVVALFTGTPDGSKFLRDDGTLATGGGGGVTDADFLVGTAHAGLSAEIVVGTSPGGELGGSWASPTVDATHSGSSHASVQAAAEATAAAALTAHSADTTAVHGIADTSALALDANVVHDTGDETIAGNKTFQESVAVGGSASIGETGAQAFPQLQFVDDSPQIVSRFLTDASNGDVYVDVGQHAAGGATFRVRSTSSFNNVFVVDPDGDVTVARTLTLGVDDPYDATGWNGSLQVPTKNAVRDKIEDILDGVTFTGDVVVPDEAYDATAWNGSLEVPTKNAVRDKIETLGGASVSDAAYGAGWNGDTTVAPSKNAVYDEMELRVPKSLYDANTILAATSDNTPAALTVAASRFVGRKASGDIAAMTAAEARAVLAMPGEMLASKHYDPGSQVDVTFASGSTTGAYEDIDDSASVPDGDLTLPDFTVPASGEVDIVMSAYVSIGTASAGIGWNVRDGSGNVTGTDGQVFRGSGTTDEQFVTYRRRKTGLTPGATITGWKWGHARTVGTGNVFTSMGGSVHAGALFEVFAV